MSSLKDYVENMMESQVVAEDEVGDLYTGTLKKFSTSGQLEVELSSAVKFSAASENEKTVKKFENNIILKAKRIVGDGTKTVTERVFLTDSKIASNKTNQNGGNEHFNESDTELDLQAWEDDGSGEYATNDYESGVTDDLDNLGGWSVADMFHANKDKCVGNGTVFDESEFSNVGIGEYSKEELEKAQAIAQQIAMNPASRHNAQLENDDEERDLDAATKFDANEKSQRGSGKMNDEIKQQRQVLEKVSISASKIPSTNNRNEEKYVKKMTTSEKKTFPQKVTTTELNDTQKMTNKKFEKEKKVENVDVSPPPEPLPPQIAKASTPVPNRKYSGGGGRKSADKAVLVQNSEQGDKVERIFKLDLNALPFVPSAKSATKGAKSATIVNSNVTAVSSAPTPMMSGSLVVYNNTATPVTNNLVTVANNFGNNFMANQMIPIPTATLQPFQYAQIQHTHIPQAQPPLSHQQLPAHVLSRSPPVQPQQQQHIQQAMMPATLHQTQHAAFQQQQQVAGFYAAAGAEGTNLSAYVLNWGAANANNFGNNFMANQMIPVPTATLQPFQYAQIQAPIPQTQPQLSHQQLPAHVLSRSPSVQPQQQQHVQQAMMPATLHQTQHAAFQQQQQVAGFYAAAGAEGTNLSAYVLNWGAANANNFGNNFMANQMIPVPAATLQPFQQQQPH